MIEIKISYDPDPERALENTRFWAPLSLTAEQKHSIDDPLEMEKAADELPIEQVAKRWIVASDPDEAVEKVGQYVDVGTQPPGLPRARPRPAPVPRAVRRRIWSRGCAGSADTFGRVPTAIYVASPEGDTGKSTIALGILHRLAATVAKVGVFRPITRLGEDRDYILELLLAHTTAGLPYEQCVGVSYQQLHDDPDARHRRHRRPLPRGGRPV